MAFQAEILIPLNEGSSVHATSPIAWSIQLAEDRSGLIYGANNMKQSICNS